jgi:cytochrome c-type biogenesis protein CcmF
MTLAHAGAGVFTIGAVAETAFRREMAAQMRLGQTVDFAGSKVTLADIAPVEGPNYSAQRGVFRVDGRTLVSERRFYAVSGTPTTEVGILSRLGGDTYIALGAPAEGTVGPAAWTVRLYQNPLVQLIFLGATMMAAGGGLGLVVLARRRRTAVAPVAATVEP